VDHPGNHLGDRLPGKGRAAREQLVSHRAEREDVGPAIHALPHHLLGGHVADRAHHRPEGGQVRGLEPGHPEVHHLDAAILGDHDVRGLHVPVDVAVPVCVVERVRHPPHQLGRLAHREARAPQEGRERLALDELHHEPGRPHVVDADDVGVVKATGGFRLAAETLLVPLAIGRGHRLGLPQHLDGHRTVQGGVHAEVDDAHGSRTQLLQDLVPAEALGNPVTLRHLVEETPTLAGEEGGVKPEGFSC
jgi:hypothetical protein